VAPPAHRLGLGPAQNLGAQTGPAQAFRQVEQVDEPQTERRPPGQPADHPAPVVTDENRERALILGTRLLEVELVQPVGHHGDLTGGGRIGDEHRLGRRSTFSHDRKLSATSDTAPTPRAG